MTDTGSNSAGQLQAIVDRIENLDAEIKARNEDKSAVYAEAKSNGWQLAPLKVVIRQRAQDPDKRKELEALVDNYRHALGMLD